MYSFLIYKSNRGKFALTVWPGCVGVCWLTFDALSTVSTVSHSHIQPKHIHILIYVCCQEKCCNVAEFNSTEELFLIF